MELLYRCDEHVRDHVQHKRHHAVLDVISRPPPPNLLHPFGTVGYLRRMKKEHELAPSGEKYLMMGIAQNHPRSTVRVLNVNTGETAIRQNVSWHPETPEVRRDGNQAAASEEGSSAGKKMPQPSPDVNTEVAIAMPPRT